jgi:hypothetical protein
MPEETSNAVSAAIAAVKQRLNDFVAAKKTAETGIKETKDELRQIRKDLADALRRTQGKKSSKKTPKPAGDAPEKPAKKPKPTDAG